MESKISDIDEGDSYTPQRPILIWIIAAYLVIPSVARLTGMLSGDYADVWSFLFIAGLTFQSLSGISGVFLVMRMKSSILLLAIVLVWSIVATGIGSLTHPISEQTMYVQLYTAVSLLMYALILWYSLRLRDIQYYRVQRPLAELRR